MPERIGFDRVADAYDETRGLPPTVLAKAVGVLAEELQGKRVLEIGVGTGRYAVPLQKSGIRVVGVDISPKMVARGLEKGMRDAVFADGAHLPFRDATFDAVTSSHVLHLVADWRTVLQEAARVLRPEGEYFSIFERRRMGNLTKQYHEIARGLGYTRVDVGLHERDFPRLVPPSRVVQVIRYQERIAADRLLDPLERRLYTNLWKVPDDVHRQVMAVLWREYGGKDLDRSFDLEVAYWTRPKVEELARAPA